MKPKLIFALKAVFLIFVIAYLSANPAEVAFNCRKALELCAFSVIPSLFMYTVLCTFCAYFFSSHIQGGKAAHVIQCILGFFSGCAPSVHGVCVMYKTGSISKRSAECMLVLLPSCSVPFMLSFCSLFTDGMQNAFIIAFSNILACITAYLILCTKQPLRQKNNGAGGVQKLSFSHMFTSSVTKSAVSLISMCSFIIFFRVVSSMLSGLAVKHGLVSSLSESILSAFFEVTGAIASSTAFGENARLMFIGAAVGFSGLSIIMQVCSICGDEGLSAKDFIFSRLLCTLLTPLYTLLLLFLIPSSVPASALWDTTLSESSVNSFILIFTSVIILLTVCVFLYIDKKYKKSR